MARIPVSGTSDEALVDEAIDVREVISGLDPDGDGRVFYLTQLVVTNESTTNTGVVELWDQDEGIATAANQRATIVVGPNETAVVDFGPVGLKFVTNCCASLDGGVGAVNAGGISGIGYLA